MAMSANKGAHSFGVVNPKHMKMLVDVYADQFHGQQMHFNPLTLMKVLSKLFEILL
jgi:hypothetical protein